MNVYKKTGKNSIQKCNMQCRKKRLFQESVYNVDLHSNAEQFQQGWLLSQRAENSETLTKTSEAFLPPITTKVTEFATIQKYLTYLQTIAASVSMPYVNVTLDVGAAINAYKTIWFLPNQYRNIVIHLGSFHFLKENFQVSFENL